MDAIITVDSQQHILLYNRSAEKIFGWTSAEMIGQPLDRLIPARLRASHGQHMDRFAATGVSSRRMGGSAVVHGVHKSGEEFPVDAAISQLDTPEGKLFSVTLRDVTEQVNAQTLQSQLSARMAGLLDSAMDGIITIDESQRIVLYNRAAEKIFGRPAGEVIGQPLTLLMPARFAAGHAGHVKKFGATGVTSRSMGDGTVIHGRRADGAEFPLEASISQLDTPSGKLFTVILRDITDRVRTQQELSAYAAAASAIREQEKTRVARELHDELAQSLTAIKMDTIWLRDHIKGAGRKVDAKLEEMVAMIDGSVAATRRIAADLRPLLLDDLGLQAAVEWLAQNFTQRHGIPCNLQFDASMDLPEPWATGVFRIVQESLANVAKHAGATRVKVRIERVGGELSLTVEDNGSGFDVAAPRRPGSLGVPGLRERAQLLHGALSIQSVPGQGTCVEARIPLSSPGAAE